MVWKLWPGIRRNEIKIQEMAQVLLVWRFYTRFTFCFRIGFPGLFRMVQMSSFTSSHSSLSYLLQLIATHWCTVLQFDFFLFSEFFLFFSGTALLVELSFCCIHLCFLFECFFSFFCSCLQGKFQLFATFLLPMQIIKGTRAFTR